MRTTALLAPFAWRLVGGSICVGLLAAAGALHAYLTGPLVQLVLTGGAQGMGYFAPLLPASVVQAGAEGEVALAAVAAVLVGVAAVKGAAHWGQALLLDGTAERVGHQLRARTYLHLLSLPLARHRRLAEGDLVSRLLMDIQLVQQATVVALISLARQGLSALCLLAVAGLMAPGLTLVAALVLPVVGLVVGGLSRAVKRAAARGQDQVGRMAARAARGLAAVREIKSSGAEEQEAAAFAGHSLAALGWSLRRIAIRALSPLVNEVMAAVALGVILVLGGGRIAAGELAPERFISFFVAAVLLYRPVKECSGAAQQLAAGRASVERIASLLELPPEAPARSTASPGLERAFELRGVGFSYEEGAPVLDSVDLRLEPGKVVALAGPSGAGKTTLANIVCGLEPPDGGELRWDEELLDPGDLAGLRARVALVPQQPLLLDATLEQNLRLGNPAAPEEALRGALAQADLQGVVARLDAGLKTVIGPEGVQLSVGEVQRVAVARALLQDRSVIALDEPSSALDPESEAALVRTIRQVAEEGMAVLVVAHREAMIEAADEVVRLGV